MPGFRSYGAVEDAYLAGRYTISGWRKTPSQTTGVNIWFDLSMSGGGPVPNYYASTPLIWSVLKQSTNGGLRHGGDVSPATKHLKSILFATSAVTTSTPLPIMLLDYLGYYPFVDMAGVVTVYPGTSPNPTGLTRYTDGLGVKIMAVEVAPMLGSNEFYITYTNELGQEDRTSKTVRCNAQNTNGTIVTSGNLAGDNGSSPFIPLQAGDNGVRSIQSVTWITDDVGLLSLVLVKPLASLALDGIAYSQYSPTERDFMLDSFGTLPVIKDDAYLNFICLPAGTIASSIMYGTIETIWSE
jgi:hypothetical protein